MPKPRKNDRFAGKYFSWRLLLRNGVYWADGRSNSVKLGRYSLGTREREEIAENLQELDIRLAVEHRLADPSMLVPSTGGELPLAAGRKLYEDHVARAPIAGGARKSSQKRYRAVLDKLIGFLESRRVNSWNRVNAAMLEQYLTHLEKEGYAYGTQYLEGTTVKQIVNFLVTHKHVPAEAKIVLPLPKPQGTDTYCWKVEEVVAIRAHTMADSELVWLHEVLSILTFTGLRIGELLALRWRHIDFGTGMINLVDESTSSRKRGKEARTLKGGRNRSFPINAELKPLLEGMSRHADGYVCHGPRGGRVKADTVRNIFIRDVLTPLAGRFPTPREDIGFAHGRLHSFRHFFCSMCANKGVPQQIVMNWLGHQDSKLVAHYYHLHDDEAHRQMQKINLNPRPLADGETEK